MRTSRILAIGIISGMTSLSLAQQANQAAAPNNTQSADAAQQAWRTAVVQRKVPATGCFKVVYPSQEWVSIPCAPRPARITPQPMPKKLRDQQKISPKAPGGADAGNGVDFLARAVAGTIVSSKGYFSHVITTGEINVSSGGITSRNSQFSLQMNSNFFKSPACSGSTTGECVGWEQFILSNDPGSPPDGYLWIQDWLLDYGPSCPSGWGSYGSGPDCVYNAQGAGPPVITSIQSLASVWMQGVTSSGGKDTVYLGWTDQVPQAMAYSQDSKLDLAGYWTQSEFNVLGDLTFHQAKFDPKTSIMVYQNLTFANDPGVNPLTAVQGGTSGETNNLDLNTPPCVQGSLMHFEETNLPHEPIACPTICEGDKKLVAFDQAQLAKAQAALTGPTCSGPARFECTQTIKADQTALSTAIAEEKKYCGH